MAKKIVFGAVLAALAAAFLWPDAVLFAARQAGYSVCHQWPEHSFSANGVVFPLCARCTGTYFGALAALGFIWAAGRGKSGDWPGKSALIVMAMGFAAMAVDGINSFVDVVTSGQSHLYLPNNALRFVTGSFNGIVLVSFGYPLLNYVLWKDWKSGPILRNAGEVLIIVAANVVVLGIIGASDALLPLSSLMSLAGVVILFSGINAALWQTLARRDRHAGTLREALPALGAGLCMALGELLLIGLGRGALERYLLRMP